MAFLTPGIVGLCSSTESRVFSQSPANVRPDPQGVTDAQRWQDRRAAGEEERVAAHGHSHGFQGIPASGLAGDVGCAFAGQGPAVEKVELKVVVSPPAHLLHELLQPMEGIGMRGIECKERLAPIEAGRDESVATILQEPVRMLAEQSGGFDGNQRRQPQSRLSPRGGDLPGKGSHARRELFIRVPVTDGDLPTVVDLDHVERQSVQTVDDPRQHQLVDGGIQAVPRAPHAGSSPGGGPQSLSEKLRVAGKHLLLGSVGDEPVSFTRLVPAVQVVLLQLHVRIKAEGTQQQDLLSELDRTDPRSVRMRMTRVEGIAVQGMQQARLLNRKTSVRIGPGCQ